MNKPKLTIDQLKNYLGTGLKLDTEGEIQSLYGLYQSKSIIRAETEFSYMALNEIKPICYRLSDLDKFIPELGFVPIEELLKIATEMIWGDRIEPIGDCEILKENDSTGIIAWNDTERVSFTLDKEISWFDFSLYVDGSEMKLDKFHLFQKLFQWHFWPFGEEYFEQGLVIDKLNQGKEVCNG